MIFGLTWSSPLPIRWLRAANGGIKKHVIERTKKKTRVGGANAPTNQEAAWGLMGEKKTGTDRDTPPLNRTQSDSIVRGPSKELLFADLHLIELKFTTLGFWLDEFQFSLKFRYKINELSE